MYSFLHSQHPLRLIGTDPETRVEYRSGSGFSELVWPGRQVEDCHFFKNSLFNYVESAMRGMWCQSLRHGSREGYPDSFDRWTAASGTSCSSLDLRCSPSSRRIGANMATPQVRFDWFSSP
ncbi:hypothetical protein ElyMa_000294200 [Elysia marginata]|uniref:Uncharacterized protein n=1 Tax=Elysia marginata TaxID=1093978 RepID=A0AAV4F6U6_9GAST|nr:hypothetical protein ElyMa_000294200 [Elysia marginata]